VLVSDDVAPRTREKQVTRTAIATPDEGGVDNFDWLQTIDDHADLRTEHLLAAYTLLGVETDLTDERLFMLLYDLETYGLLRAEVARRKGLRGWLQRIFRRSFEVRYDVLLPEEIVPDSELEW
jgi:hypothetical protein